MIEDQAIAKVVTPKPDHLDGIADRYFGTVLSGVPSQGRF